MRRSGGDSACGDSKDGESLSAAADRILLAAPGVEGESTLTSGAVHAVDLSAPRKLFAEVSGDESVGFRAMTRADLDHVGRWHRAPHAARWFRGHDLDHDIEWARERFGPRIDGIERTRMWVIEINGRSVGYVQDYLIGDHPEYAILTAEPDAIGIDYVIGEPSWVGRGIGTRVLWTFLREVVRPGYPDATTYAACPDHRNGASLRVLEKLGFEQGLWFDEPQVDGSSETLICCKLDAPRIFG